MTDEVKAMRSSLALGLAVAICVASLLAILAQVFRGGNEGPGVLLLAPILLLATVVGLMTGARWYRGNLRQSRLIRGVCPHCGFNLVESKDRCPECGHFTAWTRLGRMGRR